ncbi:MAG: hypothetical protein KJ000_14020 [Pirellulaceae bacterium]|nr:hypothetical protein [Pirellulaceae bacterium]
MRASYLIACAVLPVAVLAASLVGTAAAQPPDLPGFLEVEKIGPAKPSSNEGKWTFNMKRPYVISINEKLPVANAARNRLVAGLHDRGQLDQFVFEWFGSDRDAPDRLNLVIGQNFPVGAAQAVIATFAADSALPVYIHRRTADDEFGHTQRVYVGSLRNRGEEPMKAEQIKALLNPVLTHDELMQLLPEATN